MNRGLRLEVRGLRFDVGGCLSKRAARRDRIAQPQSNLQPPTSSLQPRLLFLCVLCALCGSTFAQEIKGICLASARGGYGSESCRQQLAQIRKLGANWIALNDYAWMTAVDRPEIRYGRN